MGNSYPEAFQPVFKSRCSAAVMEPQHHSLERQRWPGLSPIFPPHWEKLLQKSPNGCLAGCGDAAGLRAGLGNAVDTEFTAGISEDCGFDTDELPNETSR